MSKKYKLTGTIDGTFEGTIEEIVPIMYPCAQCPQVFNTQEELVAHVLSAHPVMPGPQPTLPAPKLANPANGMIDAPLDVQLLIYSSTNYTYKHQVATNDTFVNPIFDGKLLSPYRISGLQGGTKHYWRVMATKESTGEISPWSVVWNFTTVAGLPIETDVPSDSLPIYPVPPMPEPIKGMPFRDRTFGTNIVKIIDAQLDFTDTTKMTYLGWVRHDAESPDGTKLVVQATKSPAIFLFNATPPYEKIRDMPMEITDYWDPDFRWPHDDSSFLYVTYAAKFAKFDYTKSFADGITVLHDFTQDFLGLTISRVYGKEGGNPSADDRYWCWCVRCSSPIDHIDSILVYDKDTDTYVKLSNSDPKCRFPIFTGMSPSGNYAIVDTVDQGVCIYPRDLSSLLVIPVNVPYGPVHAFPGVGYDDEGREVIVFVEPYQNKYWVVMADISTGEKTYLVPFGYSPNFNASAIMFEKPGWAVISGTKTAGTLSTSWSDGEIFIVQLTRKPKPKIIRLAQTHTARTDHNDDLFAKPNKKGTKIFFRSNWGTPFSQGGSLDAYQIDLPDGWDEIKKYMIDDFTFYPIPDIPKPPKGQPIIDPVFGTEVVRITDALPDVGINYMFPGYPKHDIENADGTVLFLQSYKYPGWHLWDANPPYNKIKDMPTALINDVDPDLRWDSFDPDILYCTQTTKFYRYNIVTNEIKLLYDFKPDFPDKPVIRVFTAEEGDSSADSRYWCFKARCHDVAHVPAWWDTAVFVYDKDFYAKDSGKIISILHEDNPLFHGFNFTAISFDGNWVWCTEPGVVYPVNFSSIKVVPINGHASRGISKEGDQVILGASDRYDGYVHRGWWTKMFNMATGVTTWLAPMALGAGLYHVSANSLHKPGWGLISVYGPKYPTVPTTWDEQSSYLVEMTTRTSPPPRVWRLHHTRTIYTDYGTEPFAKINKKGTKVWFSSGWGKQRTDPGGQCDVYQVNLPSTWYEDLG